MTSTEPAPRPQPADQLTAFYGAIGPAAIRAALQAAPSKPAGQDKR